MIWMFFDERNGLKLLFNYFALINTEFNKMATVTRAATLAA